MSAKDVHKFVGYGIAAACLIGGILLHKYVGEAAGDAALIAGAWLAGKLSPESLPGRAP